MHVNSPKCWHLHELKTMLAFSKMSKVINDTSIFVLRHPPEIICPTYIIWCNPLKIHLDFISNFYYKVVNSFLSRLANNFVSLYQSTQHGVLFCSRFYIFSSNITYTPQESRSCMSYFQLVRTNLEFGCVDQLARVYN